MLLIAIFAIVMPAIQLRGASIQEITRSSAGFFFIWTLCALGAISTGGQTIPSILETCPVYAENFGPPAAEAAAPAS